MKYGVYKYTSHKKKFFLALDKSFSDLSEDTKDFLDQQFKSKYSIVSNVEYLLPREFLY